MVYVIATGCSVVQNAFWLVSNFDKDTKFICRNWFNSTSEIFFNNLGIPFVNPIHIVNNVNI